MITLKDVENEGIVTNIVALIFKELFFDYKYSRNNRKTLPDWYTAQI